MENRKIIEKIRNKDQLFIQKLYKESKKPFTSYVMSISSIDHEIAAEFYQEAFYRMYCNVIDGKLTKLTSKISTYLIAIGKNMVLDGHQRGDEKTFSGIEIITSEDPINSTEIEQEKSTKIDLVRDAVRALTNTCKSILELFYWSGLSYAEMLGKVKGFTNIDSLKAQKKKCLYHLEEKLKRAFKSADLI